MKIQSMVCTKVNPWEPGDEWPILHPDSEFEYRVADNDIYTCRCCGLRFGLTGAGVPDRQFVIVKDYKD